MSAKEEDLTGDGGVLKTVLRPAKEGARQVSDTLPYVDVAYEGKLAATGEVFDTTRDDNTIFTFRVGKGTVIKGWDIALRTMKVGEVARIKCTPEYAYGEAGSPPKIPAGAALVFEVELLDVKPPKGSTVSRVTEERAKLDEVRKERELAAAQREEEKKRREEAKAAAATRIQSKMDAKKGGGGGKKK
eukprot:TRINITY_DN71_c0_g1_i1.p1 TRINITY_DN71_c0_g1~~TRINITY_DN71_c0_g1_i1.p1  ORF type:complete len:188 (+),score=47.94 TRINITY_DN71_c0_g1_i1:113-676(+)